MVNHKCNRCNKIFDHKGTYNRHMKRKINEKRKGWDSQRQNKPRYFFCESSIGNILAIDRDQKANDDSREGRKGGLRFG